MELLRRVCGVSLFGRRVPLLLYADEIALLARSPLEIQKMLDVVFIAAAVSYKYLGIEFCSSGRGRILEAYPCQGEVRHQPSGLENSRSPEICPSQISAAYSRMGRHIAHHRDMAEETEGPTTREAA